VLESVSAAADGAPMFFYRTSAGAEIDVVIESRRRRYAIEIKRSSAPVVTKGFWNGRHDIKAHEAIVIYPGDEPIPLGERVEALGLHQAMAWVRDRVGAST
jgi:hypothetical protein